MQDCIYCDKTATHNCTDCHCFLCDEHASNHKGMLSEAEGVLVVRMDGADK